MTVHRLVFGLLKSIRARKSHHDTRTRSTGSKKPLREACDSVGMPFRLCSCVSDRLQSISIARQPIGERSKSQVATTASGGMN